MSRLVLVVALVAMLVSICGCPVDDVVARGRCDDAGACADAR